MTRESHNRHPVDELADVRAEIKRLKAHEEELRRAVIESGDLTGDEFEATLAESMQERINLPQLRRELGTDALRPFLRALTVQVLRTRKRA